MCNYLFTSFFLLLSFYGLGQNKFHFDEITTGDGISNSWISSVFEDTEGYIWLATLDGVNRYDGYEFKTLRNSPQDSNSISANWIMSIAQDTKGLFWFGTYGEGLNKFNPRLDAITRFSKSKGDCGFGGSVIRKIITSKNGGIWILSDAGVHRKNPLQDVFEKIEIGNPWSRICQTENGEIWIIDVNDAFIYNTEKKRAKLQFQLPEPIIGIEPIGNRLFLLSEHKAYLSVGKSFKKVIELPDKIEILSNFKNGYGYLASSNNVYKYTLETNTLELVYKLRKTASITSLLIDSRNQLWVGTSKGLLKENKLMAKFKQRSVPYSAHRIVHKDSALYLAGADGFHIVDTKSYQHRLENIDLTSLYIRNDTIWIGSMAGNLYRLDSMLSITKYPIEHKYKGVNKSSIFSIVEDGNNRLWIGSWNGLYVINKKGEILHFFRLKKIKENHHNDKVLQMLPDSKGRLWVASSAFGLYKIPDFSNFNPVKDTSNIKNYRYLENRPNVLNSNVVIDIHEDKKGKIWIGTDAGLNVYNETIDGFESIFNEDRIFDEKIMAIEHDANNRLWITTVAKGIFVYDYDKELFTNYTRQDGLLSDAFLYTSSASDIMGNLYFGTDEGIQIINPEKFKNFNFENKPVITNFNVQNEKAKLFQSFSPSLLDKIRLNYDQNNFSISFSTFDFTNISKIKYAYKLVGLNDSWIYVRDGHNTAYFTNIDKGTYTFKVKAYTSSGGIENGKETSLTLAVIPPWYGSNLAYICYSILFLTIVFIIYNLQIKRKLAQLETEQLKKEEEVKLQKLISNFHYLGLTSIFSINDLDTIKNNQSEIYGILSYFATSLFDKNKIEEVFWDITENCISKLQLEDCVIYWIDKNKGILIQKAAHGNKNHMGQNILNPMKIPLGEGIVGSVAITGIPEIISDVSKDARYIEDTTPGLSELTVPIFLNNQIVGIIDSENSKKDFFNKGHLEIFKLLAILIEKKLTQISQENTTTLTNDNVYFKELRQIMRQQKLYKKSTISLVYVANQLNISPGYLSRLINQLTTGNFSDYINAFRVEEVKNRLQNNDYKNYSILSIGLESGFNSKSVFYAAFKKDTGVSPSEWMSQLT